METVDQYSVAAFSGRMEAVEHLAETDEMDRRGLYSSMDATMDVLVNNMVLQQKAEEKT